MAEDASQCVATVLLETGRVSVDYRINGETSDVRYDHLDPEGLYDGLRRLINAWESGYVPFSYNYRGLPELHDDVSAAEQSALELVHEVLVNAPVSVGKVYVHQYLSEFRRVNLMMLRRAFSATGVHCEIGEMINTDPCAPDSRSPERSATVVMAPDMLYGWYESATWISPDPSDAYAAVLELVSSPDHWSADGSELLEPLASQEAPGGAVDGISDFIESLTGSIAAEHPGMFVSHVSILFFMEDGEALRRRITLVLNSLFRAVGGWGDVSVHLVGIPGTAQLSVDFRPDGRITTRLTVEAREVPVSHLVDTQSDELASAVRAVNRRSFIRRRTKDDPKSPENVVAGYVRSVGSLVSDECMSVRLTFNAIVGTSRRQLGDAKQVIPTLRKAYVVEGVLDDYDIVSRYPRREGNLRRIWRYLRMPFGVLEYLPTRIVRSVERITDRRRRR